MLPAPAAGWLEERPFRLGVGSVGPAPVWRAEIRCFAPVGGLDPEPEQLGREFFAGALARAAGVEGMEEEGVLELLFVQPMADLDVELESVWAGGESWNPDGSFLRLPDHEVERERLSDHAVRRPQPRGPWRFFRRLGRWGGGSKNDIRRRVTALSSAERVCASEPPRR